MEAFAFEAVLMKPEGVGTWTFLSIPRQFSEALAAKGQIKVKGNINGYAYRATALPMGDGTHYLVVGKELRDHIHATQGDRVKVVIELDLDERRLDVPEELRQALDSQPGAAEAFEKMTYSRQKEWVNWIFSAKRAETRQRRMEMATGMILQGKSIRDLSPQK